MEGGGQGASEIDEESGERKGVNEKGSMGGEYASGRAPLLSHHVKLYCSLATLIADARSRCRGLMQV
jgi:hypothetical protein